jgi:hypothetical protein
MLRTGSARWRWGRLQPKPRNGLGFTEVDAPNLFGRLAEKCPPKIEILLARIDLGHRHSSDV